MAATSKIIKFQIERNPTRDYAISASTIYIDETTTIADYLTNFNLTALDQLYWAPTVTLRQFLTNLETTVDEHETTLNNLTTDIIKYHNQDLTSFLDSLGLSPGNIHTYDILHHGTNLQNYLDGLNVNQITYSSGVTLKEFLDSLTDPSYTLPADYILKNTLLNVSPYSNEINYHYNVFTKDLLFVTEQITPTNRRFVIYVYDEYNDQNTPARLLETYTIYNNQTRKEKLEYVNTGDPGDFRLKRKTVNWYNNIVIPNTLPPPPTSYVEATGNIPSKRRFHTMSSVYNFIYVMGGDDGIVFHKLNDTYMYNPYTSQFERQANMPVGKYQHTSVVYENKIYLFGGYGGAPNNPPAFSNDIYMYHPFDNIWNLVQPINSPPSPRMAHAAVVKDHYMYIYGGFDGANYLDDFWRFDFNTLSWERITPSNSIGRRAEHCMFVYNNQIHVALGVYYDGSTHHFYKDIYKYNESQNRWELVTNNLPRAIGAATATVDGNNVYFLGGYDLSQAYKDFMIYRFNDNTSSIVTTPIPALSDHAAAKVGSELFVFGGYDISGQFYRQFWVYDFALNRWSQLLS